MTPTSVHRLLPCALIALLLTGPGAQHPVAQSSVLVAATATWKYLDNGSNQGTAWRAPAFNDTAWASGPAQLGYGDGDEATLVSFGPNASAKYITTYFRHAFQVTDPAAYQSLVLRLVRDDGAVVYLNGTEVYRTNLPAGSITSSTLASSAIGGADESAWQQTTVSPSLLVAGTNVLAVEMHQSGGTSSDISFALELTAGGGVVLTRGPYLQLGTPSSVVVRWRTSTPVGSRVLYGPSHDALGSSVSDAALRTNHEVTLNNLLPDTRYCYAVGTPTTTLAGADPSYCFTTAPPIGTPRATRIWVLGDSGTADSNARAVRDAYAGWTGARGTDLWLMLGDNAYESGTDAEFQAAVFDMYPTTLRSAVLWPTLGNHDGVTANSSTGTGPYYDIFTLPKQAEAGGTPSGTEAYYSFDYGNVHFVSLESFETDRSSNGPMLTWLREDLASTAQPWLVVFFHHPPYSKGSHNSDTAIELVEMRQNALPILEDAGVDLVLTGHSHSYERSFLIDGHYGTSNTFTAAMKKDPGNGREDGTGAYGKPASLAPHAGAVYAVAGSSGKISGGTLNHPAMVVSLNSLGSMVLDVNDDRLDAVFLDQAGVRRDYFTILKGGTAPVAPNPPTGLQATASVGTVTLAWTDASSNESGFYVERATGAGGAFTRIATPAADATGYVDGGRAPGTLYRYRVQSWNAAGASAYSNEASATTPAPPAVPAAPSGLTATARSTTVIDLAWVDNATNETGFEIQRSTNGTSFTAIGTVGANVRAFASAGLAKNRLYYFRVRAIGGGSPPVYSGFSNTASAKTPKK
jgi:hypothetical protein